MSILFNNIRRASLFYLFPFLIIVLAAAVPVSVLAVTVGPPKIEYRVDPGTVINDSLLLINESGTQQTFWPAFEKFTEVNGEKSFLPAEPTELASWIKLPKSVTLSPGEQKQIPFTIEVPQNAPPGGHFAVIWWGTASPEKQVSIVTRAGILVYLQVSGKINESGKLVSFSTENNQFFFVQLPENFNLRFNNAGNTYLKPQGEILIKNILGQKIANFGVNEINIILLPNDENNLRIAKKFDKPPFALGFYKADLTLRWGDKPESIKKNIWFFVFPWQQVLGGLIVLAVLFFGLKKGIKKYNQWIVSKYVKK